MPLCGNSSGAGTRVSILGDYGTIGKSILSTCDDGDVVSPCRPVNLSKQEAEEAALAKENKLAAQAAAREAAAAAAVAAADQIVKSPSDFSCHSYELFINQERGNDDNNRERMSIRSIESVSEQRVKHINNHTTTTKVRKVSAVSRAANGQLTYPYQESLRKVCVSPSTICHPPTVRTN
ncbi:sodium channel protein para-like [Ceratina calcarata]|uniref:Sodium channel protein para-like n=1 Tax=Ceratina calcarata TaxID=156304 RepID=A0AAJ7S1Z0_9HYME|nr:sodium channel protein para-like [Ceratina calcarata]